MKIAICVPHYGPLPARFVASLSALIAETAGMTVTYNGAIVRPKVATLLEDVAGIELKRTRLALRALQMGADYIQWIDSDQTFPPDATIRLAKHDMPIVGCNYPTRRTGEPTAVGLANQRVTTTKALADLGLVEPVGAVGLGFCLMKAPIFNAVPHPWFASEISPKGELTMGEDVHFANQARKVGIETCVDHGLSWQIGHIGEVVRFNSDLEGANADSILPSTGP